MQKDIRSFFGGSSSRKEIKKTAKSVTSQVKKRTALTDEATRPETPLNKRPKAVSTKKRKLVVDSDFDSDPENPVSSKFRGTKERPFMTDDKENMEHLSTGQEKPSTNREIASRTAQPRQMNLNSKADSAKQGEKDLESPPSKKKKKSLEADPRVDSKAQTHVFKFPAPPRKANPEKPKLVLTEPSLNLRIPSEKLDQWVDKYRPTEFKTIVGQHTDQSPANKLLRWLKDWARNNPSKLAPKDKKKEKTKEKTKEKAKEKTKQVASKNKQQNFRAALLSGPPGIGKTTTATLICESLGLKYLELNASMTRSKKVLDQKISEFLYSQRIQKFFTVKPKEGVEPRTKLNHVLIVDEVDGMAGNQDRSGVSELINYIKTSEIPIICICNDRQSQKIRTLATYCLDLRFQPPRLEQILGRMMTIATREKLNIGKGEMEKLIRLSNMDLRQSIYNLQLMSAGKDVDNNMGVKDVSVNLFEAARQLLSPETNIMKKRELFFTDYNMLPLFVQENYLQLRPRTMDRKVQMRAYRNAAESIAMSEVLSSHIRSTQNWSLLPMQGMLSCVLPPLHLKGRISPNAQMNFPAFLGKLSNKNKRLRLLRELNEHIAFKISGPQHAVALDYIPAIQRSILQPLAYADSVKDAIIVYHAYDLVKEDLETMRELGIWNERGDLWKQIKPAVKSGLTRAINKNTHKKHFPTEGDVVKIGKKTGGKTKSAKPKIAEVDEDGKETDDEELVQAEILNAC